MNPRELYDELTETMQMNMPPGSIALLITEAQDESGTQMTAVVPNFDECSDEEEAMELYLICRGLHYIVERAPEIALALSGLAPDAVDVEEEGDVRRHLSLAVDNDVMTEEVPQGE